MVDGKKSGIRHRALVKAGSVAGHSKAKAASD